MLRRIASVLVFICVPAMLISWTGLSFAQEKQGTGAKTAKAASPQAAGRKTQTATSSSARGKGKKAALKAMPLTTASVKARDLYQRAVQDFELLYLERANIGWRAAAKEDPEFAAAFAMVAMNSRDPEEMRSAREKATELAPRASAGERLLVGWVTAVQEGKFLEGIAAMNDLIAMFPKDKHMYYLAANWLMGVRGEEQAHYLLHKALDIDPKFAPALNNKAYLHARERDFDGALESIDLYASQLPKEPNPQDSYGEILRLAGRFEASIVHYRTALAIDPNFNTSQLGLGDTYAVMGDQEQARQEYDKAIEKEPNAANRFDYRMQKAVTWVREKNYTEADRELWRISVEAHAQSYELQEAQALRRMAQYAADDQLAVERLVAAEDALTHRQNLSPADRAEELAQILRLRAARLMHASKTEDAQKALNRLGELAAGNRTLTIQQCWHGAAGEMLAAQGNFKEAVPELEEDQENPASLAVLVKAYKEAGSAEKSKAAEERLRSTNEPSLERVLAGGSEIPKPSQTQDPVAKQ